jgi:hypothetical protein
VTVTSRVRHIIEITTTTSPTGYNQHPTVIAFDFESRDIGFTQGTTIRHNHDVIAQYRPGTRHWDRALDIAEQNLAKAAEQLLTADGTWDAAGLPEALAKVLADDNCSPWDGLDPQEDL